MSFARLEKSYETYNKVYTKYNELITAYETERLNYNTLLAKELRRISDTSRYLVEPPVDVPKRPCPPD